jgi:hypothetical protein
LAKTTADDSRADLSKTKADDTKTDTSKSKVDDSLPLSSNKRKDLPNLDAKFPRKTQKVDKALLESKRVLDDPLLRIYPLVIPLVPLAGLPDKKVQSEELQEEDDAREEEEDSRKPPPPG